MIKKEVKKYLVVALILLMSFISYLIVKPFIGALLTSFVLAYLFYPLHKKITLMTKNEIISAALTTILIILIMLLPMVYIANSLVKESLNFYKEGIIDETKTKLSSYLQKDETISQIVGSSLDKLATYTKQQATNFIAKVPSRIFDLLITIYTTFAFLLVGKDFLHKAKNLLPVKKKDELVKHLGETTSAIVYGLFLTAIIEFIIALIAFKLIGTKIGIILALTIGFLVFIPFIGSSVIIIPYIIIELLRNNVKNIIILIILGAILFLVETFIKTNIIGSRSKLHPVIVLIGTIGGIKLLGFVGLIVGPLLLSSIIIIVKEYYPEIENEIQS
ncbi:AI-2E family transporter [Candidatus Woesearchaeota archaeon]|nr:AI-2E family transporter [Candidatus Woesearchaeota archaeon]